LPDNQQQITDHWGHPVVIGKTYEWVYHNRTSTDYIRVVAVSLTPKMVRVEAAPVENSWRSYRARKPGGTAVDGRNLFPVPYGVA
jgi:hypothetical protein